MSESDETIGRYGVRKASPLGVAAMIVALIVVSTGMGLPWPVIAALGGILIVREIMNWGKPTLEIRRTEIHYQSQQGTLAFRRVLRLADVDRIEWPGGDNIGIRRKSGDVVSINLMVLPKNQWDDARRNVLEAVEHYQRGTTGRSSGHGQETPRENGGLV